MVETVTDMTSCGIADNAVSLENRHHMKVKENVNKFINN